MTQITLLVDQYLPEENRIVTPGEILHIKKDHGYHGPEWLGLNTQLLLHWHNSKEFNIVPISEYDTELHENPHYLINGSGSSIVLYQSLRHIPDSSSEVIRKYKIPILIFYALEYATCSICKQWLENFCNTREEKNLSDSKIKILAVDSLYDRNFNKLRLGDLFPEFKDRLIEFVEGVGWIDCWNSDPFGTVLSVNKMYELNGDFVNLEDHDLQNKKYIALCLNNQPRLNRMLLLHALFNNRKNINDMIISQRFNMRSGDVIFLLHDYMKIISANYPKYKSDLLYKLFDPRIHTNLDYFLHLKNHLSTVKDPVKKFILEMYCNAKEFRIPGIRLPEENANPDLNNSWNKNWYKESWASIIPETFSSNGDFVTINGMETPMISEKTLKPILNHHPFVIFGHNYSHKLLRRYGFKTFDESWFELPEEGAEGNQTIFERLYNLIESLKRLSTYTDEHIAEKWQRIVPDLIHNKNHLLHNNWAKIQKEIILSY